MRRSLQRPRTPLHAIRTLLLALAALGGAGCLSPQLVGVRPIAADRGQAELAASALSDDRLSDATLQTADVYEARDLVDHDLSAALRKLHAAAVAEPSRPLLFAIAELAYLQGRRHRDPEAFLMSAVYAYLYLFGDEAGDPLNPFDRRTQWASDLYDQGLLRAGLAAHSQAWRLEPGVRELEVGSLDLRAGTSTLPPGRTYAFLAADCFRIAGLKVRLRDSGLGVPLIAVEEKERVSERVMEVREMPATAFLRVEGGIADLAGGLRASLELLSGYTDPEVEVGDERIPLETDRSVVLAHLLDRREPWSFSLKGLFGGDRAARDNRLLLIQPYRRGAVPVVFVHGTGSSPAYWADLFNTLLWTPELRRGLQFWFFQYTTGNPIVYSAADLRDALEEAVQRFDPGGEDEALRRMVIVGHSQGGLLARSLIVDSDLSWFEEMTGQTLAEANLTEEQMALMERCFVHGPLPTVERVVFVSTPHRGSFLATRWFGRLTARLVELPGDVAGLSDRIRNNKRLPEHLRARPTSLANMDPGSPYLKRLASEPMAGDVHLHSIIAIGEADPDDPEEVAKADDGVVAYSSAHLAEAVSEDLVPGGHSCQSAPATIRAMRRILLEHLGRDAPEPAEGARR